VRNPAVEDACSPEILAMLYRVLDDSLHTIAGNGQVQNGWREELRIHLAKVIMTEFEKGVRDPQLLRRMALTSVAMGYIGKTGRH
jgi:hypothetical protein